MGQDVSDEQDIGEGRGADHFAIAWRLTAGAWLGCALLQLTLYLRPSPYGGPFLVQWKTFIVRPLIYELLSTWLLLYRRPLRLRWWRPGRAVWLVSRLNLRLLPR